MPYSEHIIKSYVASIHSYASYPLVVPITFNGTTYSNAMFHVEHLAVTKAVTSGCGLIVRAETMFTDFQFSTSSGAIVTQSDVQIYQPYYTSQMTIGWSVPDSTHFQISAGVGQANTTLTWLSQVARIRVTY